MSEEEFEDIFGNVPFENIKKIQKYIEDNYVSLDLYNKEKEKNKKLQEKCKEKVIEIKNKKAENDFITSTQGKLDTIIALESLLEEE